MDESLLEEWNMAKAYFFRVDELLTACAMSQMKDDLLGWYKAIYRLYIEIQPKMDEKQKEKAREMLRNITQAKNESLVGNKKISIGLFVDFELFLRQILEDKSLMTPKKDLRGL